MSWPSTGRHLHLLADSGNDQPVANAVKSASHPYFCSAIVPARERDSDKFENGGKFLFCCFSTGSIPELCYQAPGNACKVLDLCSFNLFADTDAISFQPFRL